MLKTLASYRKEGGVWANRAHTFNHGFSGIRVALSLVFYVVFCRSLFVFCRFSFGHCIACPSSIYAFWLPLCYLQTFLNRAMCYCSPENEQPCICV